MIYQTDPENELQIINKTEPHQIKRKQDTFMGLKFKEKIVCDMIVQSYKFIWTTTTITSVLLIISLVKFVLKYG